MFSIANFGIQIEGLDYILWSVLLLLITISNFFAIKKAKKIDRVIDVMEDTPADYSLLISRIPKEDTEEDIKKYISGLNKEE